MPLSALYNLPRLDALGDYHLADEERVLAALGLTADELTSSERRVVVHMLEDRALLGRDGYTREERRASVWDQQPAASRGGE